MKNSVQHYLTSAKLKEADIAYFERKLKAKNIQPEQLKLLEETKKKLKKIRNKA